MQQDMIDLLQKIKDDKFDFKDIDKLNLATSLMDYIGDLRSEVRDDLIYVVLAHLFHDQHLNEEELTQFLKELKSESHLFYDMNNKEQWSILKRSFSILQLVILVYVHRRDHVIDVKDIDLLFDDFMNYLSQEKVFLGYDESVGWVHATAHSADLLAQFMQLETCDEKKLMLMFNQIQMLVKQRNEIYTHNEDERLVKAVIKGLDRNLLTQAFLTTWVKQFTLDHEVTDQEERLNLKHNIKQFLSSLYFSLQGQETYTYLHKAIKDMMVEELIGK
jgi:hypothetical protein